MERERWRGEGERDPPPPLRIRPVSSLSGERRPGGGGQEIVGGNERSAGGRGGGPAALVLGDRDELDTEEDLLLLLLLLMFCCIRQWILNQLDRRPYLVSQDISIDKLIYQNNVCLLNILLPTFLKMEFINWNFCYESIQVLLYTNNLFLDVQHYCNKNLKSTCIKELCYYCYLDPDLDMPTMRHFLSLQALQAVRFFLSTTHLSTERLSNSWRIG